MGKVVSDQADGLRRLMAHSPARLVAIVGSSAAVGATSVALNLAAALAQSGKDVLLLDEQSGLQSVSAIWKIAAAGTWSDVATQRMRLEAAAGFSACGVQVLSAGPAMSKTIENVHAMFQGRLVLIDAALDSEGALSPLASQADEILVVLQPQAASITAAYVCVKRLQYAHGLQQLRTLINCAASAAEAQRVLTNLSNTGNRYLALALSPVGCVMADPRLPRAQQLNLSVVEAFQTSPSAIDFRRIAAELLQWPWRSPAGRLPVPIQATATGKRQSDRLPEPS
ncbi:MAG: flagellar biosynthesis protein FlhG [Oxalobacteraceae bacterium]